MALDAHEKNEPEGKAWVAYLDSDPVPSDKLLLEVIREGHLRLFQALFPLARDRLSQKAIDAFLAAAVKEGQIEILADLMDSLPREEAMLRRIMERAAKYGQAPVVRLLHEGGVPIDRHHIRQALISISLPVMTYFLAHVTPELRLEALPEMRLKDAAENNGPKLMPIMRLLHSMDHPIEAMASGMMKHRFVRTDPKRILELLSYGASLKEIKLGQLNKIFASPWDAGRLPSHTFTKLPYCVVQRHLHFRRSLRRVLGVAMNQSLSAYVIERI